MSEFAALSPPFLANSGAAMPACPIRTGTRDWTEQWTEIRGRIRSRPSLLLALSLDGIFSRGADSGDAAIPGETGALLSALDASSRVTLVFLSSGSQCDMRDRIQMKNAFY